jgi:protein-S-isoprenylcysteine O-methyltransferase Ste14
MADNSHSIPSVSSHVMILSVLFGAISGIIIVYSEFFDYGVAAYAVIAILAMAFPCLVVEVLVNNSPSRSGIKFYRRSLCVRRVVRKIVCLWVILSTIGILYNLLPLYRSDFYSPFMWLWGEVWWMVLILAMPYVAVVDMAQDEPDDDLLGVAECLLLWRPISKRELNYLLGWIVKAFFFPLMFCYLCGQIVAIRDLDPRIIDPNSFMDFASNAYDVLFIGTFYLDLLVSAAGYIISFRIIGTHIRSVEPSVSGWIVTLVCYQPFYFVLYDNFLMYGHDRPWGVLFYDSPILYTIWALLISSCLIVYGWATACFGIRFSNLTNRGIITTGPYRWTKHPAYIAKNISWWLISVPFIPPDASPSTAVQLCLGLFLINCLYFMRARTEERHLSSDPVYRQYAQYVNDHGLFRHLIPSAWRPAAS